MDTDILTDCAKNMWAFPLIGSLLGLLTGIVGYILYTFFPSIGIAVGAIVLALLLWLTGLHHTDGLLDFGDAIMVHGAPEHKIAVMHDQFTGAGAIGLVFMTYAITVFAFAGFGQSVSVGGIYVPLVLPGVIVIELCAKLAMVVAAWAGKAVHEGMNTSFLQYMHGQDGTKRLLVALAISLVITVPILWVAGVLAIAAAVVTGLFMVVIAHRNFNGVTGDVFGATNEITRMVCAVVLLAVVAWA